MKPLDFYDKVFVKFLQTTLEILGVNVFIEYKRPLRATVLGVFLVIITLSFIYTFLSTDRSMTLQSLSMFAMPVQV